MLTNSRKEEIVPSAEDPFYESVEFRGLTLHGHKTTRGAVELLPHVPLAEVHRMNLTSDNRGRRRVAFALVTNHFRFFAASWASHLRARVSSE